MKKIALTIVLSFLVTICFISTSEYVYSHDTCDDNDYFNSGSVALAGPAYDPEWADYCVYDVNVLHYTNALTEGEEIYVFGQDTCCYPAPGGTMELLGFRNEAALCSVYGLYIYLQKGHSYDIWFHCEHIGEPGRDPDSGAYEIEVPTYCCP